MMIEVSLVGPMPDGTAESETVFKGERDDFFSVALGVNFYLRIARDEGKALEVVKL